MKETVTDNSECDIILAIMLRISMFPSMKSANGSAVVVSMLAIYALITNPLLLFVMVRQFL